MNNKNKAKPRRRIKNDPHPVRWYVLTLEPRSRLRFRHPKGGVTILRNDGPGFIKVDQAVVFDGEFVRVHDTARVSTITSQQQTAHIEIVVKPRTDVTLPPRKIVSLKDVAASPMR
jgi:hypothetical protein